ncbi:sensor histidine kinase [Actinophytocola xinjiangensis]|uniref:sensor histidine kinase n=1 Tax=Actinophytocola xinjiangensis TaxID=485602 RepID=UPI000A52DF9E|nr:histidine kinase [Actinophytocola xinjiangensis]
MFVTATRPLRVTVDRWRALPASAQDIALAVLLAVLAFVPFFADIGAQVNDAPRRETDAIAVALGLIQCLPLAVRRGQPALCLGVIAAGFAVHQALAYPLTFGSVGLYLAIYAVGAHQTRHRRGLATALTLSYLGFAVLLRAWGSPNEPMDFATFFIVLVVIWLAGTVVRRWRDEEAERRRLSAEIATAGERARIARELHDVVTHHVTAMVVQSDATQFLLDSRPDRARDGMAAISETGRQALTELRHLLGVLEATGDSAPATRTPALGRVTDLAEQARLSGQPVTVTEHGTPLRRAVDVELAAYRVVQEALTNAVKYATGNPTAVALHHHADRVEIEVTTSGAAVTATTVVPSGGRGLHGLGERVRMLDGDLVAGDLPDGGFRVHARIPGRGEG